jgi:type I restriction enzyme R subunit
MDALTEAIYKLKNFETGTLLQKNMVFMTTSKTESR